MEVGRHIPAAVSLSKKAAKHAWRRLLRLGSGMAKDGDPPSGEPSDAVPEEPEVVIAGALIGDSEMIMTDEHAAPLTLDELADWDLDDPAPLCLALFGEFSAGKSSLANLLAGTDILPTSVLSSTRRLTRLRYAKSLEITTVDGEGLRRPVDLSEITTLVRDEINEVEIGLPSVRLRYLEILDSPGFADPYHRPQGALSAAERADLAIWCTRASQAWRQSEVQVWASLPARFRDTGLLVVTHCDTLRGPDEVRRLAARLRREARGLFRSIVMLSIPNAAGAHETDDGALDAALWQSSGGGALTAELLRSLALAAEQRRHRAAGPPPGEDAAADALSSSPLAGIAAGGEAMPVGVDRLPSESRAPAEPESGPEATLARLMQATPHCLLAAYVDLGAERVLATRHAAPPPPGIRDAIAQFTAAILEGRKIAPIRDPIGRLPADDGPPQRLTITTGRGHYVVLRLAAPDDHAVILIGGTKMPTGATLARASLELARLQSL